MDSAYSDISYDFNDSNYQVSIHFIYDFEKNKIFINIELESNMTRVDKNHTLKSFYKNIYKHKYNK